MTSLFVADIHETENPRDSYRWGLFSWLAEQAREWGVHQIIFFGDLTEKKDRHRAELVTRIVAGMAECAEVCEVYIIPGNHDRVDPNYPFFQFLCGFDRIHFFVEPTWRDLPITGDEPEQCLFLPSSDQPEKDWITIAWGQPRFVFMHQTIIGARYESGEVADRGIPLTTFAKCRKNCEIWSGDIHTPQTVGRHPFIEYVGAPYRIDFGDEYTPRVVLRAAEGIENLRFPCVNKHLIDLDANGEIKLHDAQIAQGDQVKVRITLKRQELTLWPALRDAVTAWAREGGATLYGPVLVLTGEQRSRSVSLPLERVRRNHRQCLSEFIARENLPPDMAEIGTLILEDSNEI